MECKVTQQGVSINDVLFDETLEQPVDTEFTLPDYCPEITRVLKCKITPKISSKSINGGSLGIEGIAYVCLFYVDGDSGQVRSYEYPVQFARSLDLGQSLDGASACVRAYTDYVNCRAVSERRVDVHGALTLRVKITKLRTMNIVTDVDGAGVQMLRGSAPATSPVGMAEKYLILNDEIELSQGKQSIRSLLRTDARAVASECKIISNKIIVKGELLLSALYCGEENGEAEVLESAIPLSQIIDMDGVNEACDCAVAIDVVSLDMKPRTGMSGEARTLTVAAKLCITVRAFCNSDIPMIYDAYSTDYDAEVDTDDVTFEKVVCPVNESYLCKKTLEFSPDSIGRVTDLWCETPPAAARNEESQLVINGTVLICMLVTDTQGAPAYYERPVEYEYRHEMGLVPKGMRCEPEITAVAASYTIGGSDNIEARVELNVRADVFEVTKLPVVTDVRVREDAPKSKDDRAALVIYYADDGERIWDIARRYNTSVDEVTQLNSLTGDELSSAKMLLIPSM